jgi:hypothetical protein
MLWLIRWHDLLLLEPTKPQLLLHHTRSILESLVVVMMEVRGPHMPMLLRNSLSCLSKLLPAYTRCLCLSREKRRSAACSHEICCPSWGSRRRYSLLVVLQAGETGRRGATASAAPTVRALSIDCIECWRMPYR